MKAVIVISKFPPEYSGPGVRMPKLYRYLKDKIPDFSVQVVCNGIEHTGNAVYAYEDLPVTRLSAYGWNLPKWAHAHVARIAESIFTFLFLCRNCKSVDFVHILGNSGGTAAAILFARLFNLPTIMELVTAKAEPWQRFLFFIIKPHRNSIFITLTKNSRQRCLKNGYRPESIWLRPNPIDEDVYKPAGDEKFALRTALSPFKADDIVICSVAKIMPQKNQILLLKALVHLPEKYKLLVAGPLVESGPLYERDKQYIDSMYSLIAEHNLQNRVHLHTGFVRSADYMRATDIYGLPAWDEGFGTPMIEAMACGLPVIANSDEAAFKEWIKNGVNGYLCSIEKPQNWAEAIEKASQFSLDQRLAQSASVTNQAGQTGVYQTYADLIERLTLKGA